MPPYPSAKVFLTRFGTVSVYAYRQGLSPLSWLSYSPSAFSAERRALSYARLRAFPHASSPRLPRLYEPFLRKRPAPPGGIGSQHANVTHLRTTAAREGSLSRSPKLET